MPKIEKKFTLEITPERFLENCSLNELFEIELLLSGAIRRAKLKELREESKSERSKRIDEIDS